MKIFYRGVLVSLLSFSPFGIELLAQEDGKVPILAVKKVKTAIKLDGVLDEPDWLAADTTGLFY